MKEYDFTSLLFLPQIEPNIQKYYSLRQFYKSVGKYTDDKK